MTEPTTAAGRALLRSDFDTTGWGPKVVREHVRRAILAIEAEARQSDASALRLPHGTHTPCCAIPAEHKWADPIRCMKDHENWPCAAALAALEPKR